MTPRFTVVSSPIEERLVDTLASRLHQIVAMGAQINATAHNATAVARLRNAATESASIGSLPVFLMFAAVVVFAFQQVVIAGESRHMLRQHNQQSADDAVQSVHHTHDKCGGDAVGEGRQKVE